LSEMLDVGYHVLKDWKLRSSDRTATSARNFDVLHHDFSSW
jgi:hypothetical protein